MIRIRTSKIWTINREKLQNILDTSSNYVDVLKKLGYDGYNGNHRTLKERLIKESFDLTKIEKNRVEFNKSHFKKLNFKRIKTEDILVVNSSYVNRVTLKKRLIEEGLKEYKRACCGNMGVCNGLKLSLQLDHINGINNDNRIENLRFICPNCHSQSETFSGKNRFNNINKKCKDCGVSIGNKSKRCLECESKNKIGKYRKFEISKEELQKIIYKLPFSKIGKLYKVSDNAIRKRCKLMDIEIPKFPTGYWLKKTQV